MTLQIIRRDGKFRGFALMLGEGRIVAAIGAREQELWRICDSCGVHEAIVFCRVHAKYRCSNCLSRCCGPESMKVLRRYADCLFISVAVARDLAQRAQQYAEVEA